MGMMRNDVHIYIYIHIKLTIIIYYIYVTNYKSMLLQDHEKKMHHISVKVCLSQDVEATLRPLLADCACVLVLALWTRAFASFCIHHCTGSGVSNCVLKKGWPGRCHSVQTHAF